MTVIVQNPRQTATGQTGVFVYSFNFDIRQATLQVWVDSQLQIQDSDYTLGPFDQNGGSVTFLSQVPAGSTITFVRETPQSQQTDYQAFDSFPAQSHEDALDKQMKLMQETLANIPLRVSIPSRDATIGQLRILDLADPQDFQDAVNLRFLQSYVADNAPEGPQGPVGSTGPQGEIGPVGVLGPPGTASRWFVVTGAPDPLLGLDGDNALNSNNGDVYQKVSGSWGTPVANIQGPPGTGTTNDHSGLINLANDDHPQYLNEARGDARYPVSSADSIIDGNWVFNPSNTSPSIQFQNVSINQPTEVRVGGSTHTETQSWSVRTDASYIALQARNGQYGIRDSLLGTWALYCDAPSQRLYAYTGGVDATKQVWTAQDFTPASFAAASHTHNTTQVNVVPTISQAAGTTLQKTDEGRKRDFTAAAAVTVDTFANQNWTPNCTILIRQGGTGAVTITPGPGVTLRSFPGTTGARTLAGQGAHALLHYRSDIGVDTWDLDGKFT